MDRAVIVERIKAKEAAIRKEGPSISTYLARVPAATINQTSDLDVYVDYDPLRKFSLLDLAGIKLLLEDELNLDVHITTKNSLHPKLKDEIEAQSVCVF